MDSGLYAVLRIPNFRPALAVRFFDSVARQIMDVAAGWQIYQLTRDPLMLGFIGLAEALPYISVALWAGHLADRKEKRGILIAAESGSFLSATGLMLLAFRAHPPLLPIYLFIASAGICRCFQWIAISAYVQSAVPVEIFPKAAAWNVSVWQAAAIAGPAAGGLLYRFFGAQAAYGTAAAGCVAALNFVLGMGRMPAAEVPSPDPGIKNFLSGVRFVFSRRVMLAAMSLDMFGVLFGGVDGVLPMFAGLMGVGPSGLGLLAAAPAAGALISSLYLAHAHSFRRTGATFISCVAAFGACIIAFAISRNFWASLSILMFAGMVDCVGMVLRSSIYQAMTPDHLRGRVAAVNGIFIRTSNEIGAFESGLAAKILGLVPSVIFGGCMTLVSVAMAICIAPDLRKFRLTRGAVA